MILEVEKISEAFAKCTADDYDVLLDLNQFFSCYSDGYQFNPRFKLHLWDGKVYFFNPRTGILPIGLVPYLDDFCKKNNHTVKFINFPDYEDVNHDEYIANTKEFLKPSGMEMRDYQEAAAYEALKHRMGILQCCTSSGKSMMIYQIIRNILKKGTKGILLVVPNIMLVEQMYKDFADYGWEGIENEVEMLYGGKDPTYKLPVLISTWQSLQNQTPDFFEKYNAVIVDECVNGDTLILTPTGEKKIKDIKEGELVITYNEKTKSFEPNKVLEVHQNHNSSKNAKMLRLELEDGKILELTENHPVFTKNRGWVRAGELKEDDDIEIINNNKVSEDTLNK